jgi:hypothetical protein
MGGEKMAGKKLKCQAAREVRAVAGNALASYLEGKL